MRIEKEGKYLVNSRVDVDYKNGKPTIKFGYPQKNPKKEGIISATSGNIFLLGLFIILYFLGSHFILNKTYETDYPTNCNGFFVSNKTTLDIIAINISCDASNYSLLYDNKKDYFNIDKVGWCEDKNENALLELLIMFSLIGLIMVIDLGICFLIGYILSKQEWYKKWFPKSNANLSRIKYFKFTKKDIENNIVEIPNFSNVVLDYKTSEDFNKYLTNIKIREHKWYNVKRKKGKYKIGELKKQYSNWYARFYFSQEPKKGWLKVYYS
ncbi:MAG: hypothetical protein M0R17_05820 [Candidatus Omnitrophica bacterium]|jgi:hypothetical protein|nr:hypothetical protein [Candidatus Omnitrophota bacterium]